MGLYGGTRIAKPEPGRLLVAQLLSGRDSASDHGTFGYAPCKSADRLFLGRILRRMELCQGHSGPEAIGAGVGGKGWARPILARRCAANCSGNSLRESANAPGNEAALGLGLFLCISVRHRLKEYRRNFPIGQYFVKFDRS